MFDLNPMTCETKYETLIALQGDTFVKYVKKGKQASKNLTFDLLNEQGLHSLELVIALLFKEKGIKHSPLIADAANLLLVFLKPAEVYYLLIKLCEKSDELFKSEDGIAELRWYFTFEKPGYLKTLSTFVKCYLNTTMRGKRSILQHLHNI
jgi:hypothetical protein